MDPTDGVRFDTFGDVGKPAEDIVVLTGLARLQAEHRRWLEHNFPDQQPHDGLLGMVEEIGELAHAHLKRQQGIRTNEDHDAAVRDALGDVLIYMLSYCNTNGLDLAECVEDAWAEVAARDWAADPVAGVVP
jgi:NTP pyrophosphatase (non-canonical NTP hydrolase)